jgi:hypothetical protein
MLESSQSTILRRGQFVWNIDIAPQTKVAPQPRASVDRDSLFQRFLGCANMTQHRPTISCL